MKEQHPEAYIEQETIECKLCLMKYTKKSVYINHYQENHGSVPPEYENEDLFICELCSKCFPAVGTLRQHINAVHKKTSKEFKLSERYIFHCIQQIFLYFNLHSKIYNLRLNILNIRYYFAI